MLEGDKVSNLHYCFNGVSVTDQVIQYQETREPEDYIPIQSYYNEYKEVWYLQVEDYMDRVTFDSEFDFKLCKAVNSFKIETADRIASKKGYGRLGAFNGWFYKILANWKSNVKSSSYRLKKRPGTQCPICGRFVGKIDVEHLQHYRAISDLPRYFVWRGEIYEMSTVPRVQAVSWGEKTLTKWKALQKSNFRDFAHEKKRVPWPWRFEDGTKGVMCPFTKKIIRQIDDEYLRSLPEKYKRYAESMSWERFIEIYPTSLIYTEIFSLDCSNSRDNESQLRHRVSADHKNVNSGSYLDHSSICSGVIPLAFEDVFNTIDHIVLNESDRDILKLIASGYAIDDIAETLEVGKKEVRRRLRVVRDSYPELATKLYKN